MVKFISMFMIFNNLCYGMSEVVRSNLEYIWDLSEVDPKNSILEASKLIEDESISNLDKMHYVIIRSNIYLDNYKLEEYKKDVLSIIQVYLSYPECAEEFLKVY